MFVFIPFWCESKQNVCLLLKFNRSINRSIGNTQKHSPLHRNLIKTSQICFKQNKLKQSVNIFGH